MEEKLSIKGRASWCERLRKELVEVVGQIRLGLELLLDYSVNQGR